MRKKSRHLAAGAPLGAVTAVRMPDTTKEKLRQVAARDGNSLSNQCLLFLTAALEHEEFKGGAQ